MQDEGGNKRSVFSAVWPWLLCCTGLVLLVVSAIGLAGRKLVTVEDAVLCGMLGLVFTFHGYRKGLKNEGMTFDPFRTIRNILLAVFVCVIVVRFFFGAE